MSNVNLNAAHVIRLYLWEVLLNNGVLTAVDGEVPIIPITDEPQFANSGKPYIIYGFTEAGGNERVSQGTIAFRVIDRTNAGIIRVLNHIKTAFESPFAQEDINNYSTLNAALAGIRFGGFEITYMEADDAPDAEAARREGVININYTYVHSYEIKRFRPNARNAAGKTTTWIWR